MQVLVLREMDFYREISFLPAAAVNSLEVQQAIGFKGQEDTPLRLPAARQLSADLRSKVSTACRVLRQAPIRRGEWLEHARALVWGL